MRTASPARALEVMNSFAEVISKLLVEQNQKHLAELDLTLLQAQVLRLLRSGPILTGQLASELGISAPASTQLTDRLVRKGLIERRTGDADRRSIQLAITPRGKRLVDQFRQRRSLIFGEAFKSLEEQERAQLVAALEKMVSALEDYERKIAKRES